MPDIEETQVQSVTVQEEPEKEEEKQEEQETPQTQAKPAEETSGSQETSSASGGSAAAQETQQPFYGIWVAAFREEKDAKAAAEKLKKLGFDANVYLTSQWSGLNQDDWYAVCAGTYAAEQAAQENLSKVQAAGCSDADVKYTGDWQG